MRVCIFVGGPILVVGLLIGMAVGVLQAMTQVQDQTVAFVPKILLMFLAIGLALPWLAEHMLEFTQESFTNPAITLTNQSGSEPAWKSKGWVKPGDSEQSLEIDKVATSRNSSSMPTLNRHSDSMPKLTNGPASSMPMMGQGRARPKPPRIAETNNKNRNQ